MHFGFFLDLSDTNLWNLDLLDTHLDLLYTDITSKHFVWRRLQDMSSRHLQDTSSRHLQRNNFLSSKTSSRRLQDLLEDVKLLRWGRVEEAFKTCPEDVFKTSWRPANVCWGSLWQRKGNTCFHGHVFLCGLCRW